MSIVALRYGRASDTLLTGPGTLYITGHPFANIMVMKTLLLLRHAKSSRDDRSLRDFDRPLNDRGQDDARLVGRYLRKQKPVVDAVISSPAKRALKTTELFLTAANISLEPALDERIYEAGVQRLLTVVSEIDPSNTTVLIVGHNPGFEELAESLTGQYIRMPTATLAAIDLTLDQWRDVRPRSGKLRALITPRELKN
jgi:phosphohistidine phosphatase